MVFGHLKETFKRVGGYNRLPEDPEEKPRRKLAQEEKEAMQGVEEYVRRKIVDFVQDFGAKILPSPYGDKREALAAQEIRIQIIKYHSQYKATISYDLTGALHVEARGVYCPMMLTESPTPGQPQILAFKINSKKHPHETNSNGSEFFALPRPILYYINSKGVHKSSRGAAFAEGQWGARPSQEAYTYKTEDGHLWRALNPKSLERKAKWSVSLDEEGIPNYVKLHMPRSFTVTFSSDYNPHAPDNPYVPAARTRV